MNQPKQPKLVRVPRICCNCGGEEKTHNRSAKRLNIMAISPLMYWRGLDSKGQIKNPGRFQVCDECFILATSHGKATPAKDAAREKIWRAFVERVSEGYSELIEEARAS